MPRGVSRYDEARLQGRLWTPPLSPGLLAWWDAADASTLTITAAGLVSQWVAKGSLGLVATQATTALQPTFTPLARNGTPGLLFKQLSNGNNLSFAPAALLNPNATVAVSGYLDGTQSGVGTTDWRRAFGYGAGDNNTSIQIIRMGSGQRATEYSVAAGSYDWFNKDRLVCDVISNATGTINGSVYVDGNLIGSANYGSAFSGSAGYIGRGLQYSDPWPGFIQQILVYNRPLSPAERVKLEGWESWRTGKNGSNLYAGHTFVNRPPLIGD